MPGQSIVAVGLRCGIRRGRQSNLAGSDDVHDGIAKTEQSSNARRSLINHGVADIEVIAEPSGHHHGGTDEGREVGGNSALLPGLGVGKFLALAEQGQEGGKLLNHGHTPSTSQIYMRFHAKLKWRPFSQAFSRVSDWRHRVCATGRRASRQVFMSMTTPITETPGCRRCAAPSRAPGWARSAGRS